VPGFGLSAFAAANIEGPKSGNELRREAVEHAARAVLRRYGVVCRVVLGREAALPAWRELLDHFRRWEARGEIRGGRFVEALGGEQFALAEAVEKLRRVRRGRDGDEWLVISAADPLAMVGLPAGGERIPALPGHRIVYRNGAAVAAQTAAGVSWLASLDESASVRVHGLLGAHARDAQMPRSSSRTTG
jgi:ATP-dependent helicase Lhr and Lhr-like helicase